MTDLPDKAHYRPEEVAEYFDISVKTLYQWIAEGKVPAIKPAGCSLLRITRGEVEKMTIPELIDVECQNLAEMLKAKNRQYGNSFADPVRIFSKAEPEEALLIRIDDKLSRIARGQDAGEDTILDLIGYLVLLRVLGREQDKS